MKKNTGAGRGGIIPPVASRFAKGSDPRRYCGRPSDTAVAALANRMNGLARSGVKTARLLQTLNNPDASHIDRAAASLWLSLLGVETGVEPLTETEQKLLANIRKKALDAVTSR